MKPKQRKRWLREIKTHNRIYLKPHSPGCSLLSKCVTFKKQKIMKSYVCTAVETRFLLCKYLPRENGKDQGWCMCVGEAGWRMRKMPHFCGNASCEKKEKVARNKFMESYSYTALGWEVCAVQFDCMNFLFYLFTLASVSYYLEIFFKIYHFSTTLVVLREIVCKNIYKCL